MDAFKASAFKRTVSSHCEVIWSGIRTFGMHTASYMLYTCSQAALPRPIIPLSTNDNRCRVKFLLLCSLIFAPSGRLAVWHDEAVFVGVCRDPIGLQEATRHSRDFPLTPAAFEVWCLRRKIFQKYAIRLSLSFPYLLEYENGSTY